MFYKKKVLYAAFLIFIFGAPFAFSMIWIAGIGEENPIKTFMISTLIYGSLISIVMHFAYRDKWKQSKYMKWFYE